MQSAVNAFYSKTLFWQWMRLLGDVVFSLAALLMTWDFFIKLRPHRRQAAMRPDVSARASLQGEAGSAERGSQSLRTSSPSGNAYSVPPRVLR
jgi:hypothetical protein